MKKSEAEPAIKKLLYVWEKEKGITEKPQRSNGDDPNFSEFYNWLSRNYRSYTKFRSECGARYDIEMWFDRYFNITD